MIELVMIEKSTLDGIGDAVRERKGTTALIPVLQLRPEILSIGGTPLIAKTEQEMAELMIEENIGKFIRYEGEDGLYVNGAYYQVVLDDEADYTQYYTYKNDIDSVYFIQDSANVFSLYMLPIEVENGVSATTQTDNDGNVEVIING